MRFLLAPAVLTFLAACGDADSPTPEGPPARERTEIELTALDGELETPIPGDRDASALQWRTAVTEKRLGQIKVAKERYQEALSTDPSYVELRVDFAVFLLEDTQVKNPAESLILFREGRLLDPSEVSLIAGEGVARMRCGDYERARPLLERSLKADVPPALKAWVQSSYGRLLFNDGDLPAAGRMLELAAGSSDRTPAGRASDLAVRAEVAEAQGDLPVAVQILNKALSIDPECVSGHYLLSRILRRLERNDEADHHEKIHEVLRKMVDHVSGRFDVNHELRIELARELVAVYPEYRHARIQLIRELLKLRRYADIAVEVQTHLGQDLTDREKGELYFLSARANAGLGDLEAARTDILKMREQVATVPMQVMRQALDEWGRDDPSVTSEKRDQVFEAWFADEE